jgi:hypothetical protein
MIFATQTMTQGRESYDDFENGEAVQMRKIPSIAVLLLAASAAGCSSADQENTLIRESQASSVGPTPDPLASALKQGMRELWAEHVIWTRDYIIAATSDHPSAQVALDRLMKNQEEIGDAIVPYYGREAGIGLTTLLKEHISIAGEVVTAAKAGNQQALQVADRRWHDNAAEIAAFLSGANPNWVRADLLAMLNEHLALTTEEATARLERDWSEDAATFDQVLDQAMMMADGLAEGILKQFPNGPS